MLKAIFRIPYYNLTSLNLGLLVLRAVAGFSMAFAHGMGKIPPSEGLIRSAGEDMGFAGLFFAWAAGLSEFIGGILVGLGLMTRPAAFFNVVTMFVAFFIHHAADPFARKEKALLYLVIFLFILITGPGKHSLDDRINMRLGL